MLIVPELQKVCVEVPVGVDVTLILTNTGNLFGLTQPLTVWLA